jgi:hypothetical protein
MDLHGTFYRSGLLILLCLVMAQWGYIIISCTSIQHLGLGLIKATPEVGSLCCILAYVQNWEKEAAGSQKVAEEQLNRMENVCWASVGHRRKRGKFYK